MINTVTETFSFIYFLNSFSNRGCNLGWHCTHSFIFTFAVFLYLSFCSPKIFIFSFVPSFYVKKTNILCIFPAFRDTVTVSTILLRLSIGSVICCVYLAYILYFVLHDFCIVCVSTYVVNVVNLVLCAAKLQVLRDCKSDATARAKCDWTKDLTRYLYKISWPEDWINRVHLYQHYKRNVFSLYRY